MTWTYGLLVAQFPESSRVSSALRRLSETEDKEIIALLKRCIDVNIEYKELCESRVSGNCTEVVTYK